MTDYEKFNKLTCAYDDDKHVVRFLWETPLPPKDNVIVIPVMPDGLLNYSEAQRYDMPFTNNFLQYNLKTVKNEIIPMNFIVFASNDNRISSDMKFLVNNRDFYVSVSVGRVSLDYYLDEKKVDGFKQCKVTFFSSGKIPSDALCYSYSYKGKEFEFRMPEDIIAGENKIGMIYLPEQAELRFEIDNKYQKNFTSFEQINSLDYLKYKLLKKR